MNEIAEALRQRTRRFAVRLVKFLRLLPRDIVTIEIVRQLAKILKSHFSSSLAPRSTLARL
jgi:hypothetical protein